jgi:chromosome partitioning protein
LTTLMRSSAPTRGEGHAMARREVTSLLRQLKLPIDERGRRRAANRTEWFNQVDKPLEDHDIFGAPQT